MPSRPKSASSKPKVLEYGVASTGKTQYGRYIAGERLTQRQAILAKCFECTNGFADGRRDCLVMTCPLHPFMPYREKDNV